MTKDDPQDPGSGGAPKTRSISVSIWPPNGRRFIEGQGETNLLLYDQSMKGLYAVGLDLAWESGVGTVSLEVVHDNGRREPMELIQGNTLPAVRLENGDKVVLRTDRPVAARLRCEIVYNTFTTASVHAAPTVADLVRELRGALRQDVPVVVRWLNTKGAMVEHRPNLVRELCNNGDQIVILVDEADEVRVLEWRP